MTKTYYLENCKDNHYKFWRGTYDSTDNSVLCEWGKIGTDGQSKLFSDVGEDFLEKKYSEKLKKGYREY